MLGETLERGLRVPTTVGDVLAMPKSELLSNVEKWLKEQGYPLEMRTAQFLLHNGWLLHHSRRYKDPVIGKEREIDILAFNDDPDSTHFHGRLVIECKWAHKKPWVLFTSATVSMTPFGYFRASAMNGAAEKAIEHLISRGLISVGLASGFPLFSAHEEGYSVVQALGKSSGTDPAYSAVETAVSAADFFAGRSTEHAIIYMPTVVLDGELYQCSLAKNGDISVREVDMGLLIHHRSDSPRCVHIVRESALTTFVSFADTTLNSIRVALKK